MNPPVNLIVSETVTRLDEILRELDDDPDIQVVVFTSGVPDFFFNHFDLAAAGDFPVPQGEDAVPMWTDIVLRLSKAPYITIVSIRGRTRGGGNEARPRVRPALREPGARNVRPARGRRRLIAGRRGNRATPPIHRT